MGHEEEGQQFSLRGELYLLELTRSQAIPNHHPWLLKEACQARSSSLLYLYLHTTSLE